MKLDILKVFKKSIKNLNVYIVINTENLRLWRILNCAVPVLLITCLWYYCDVLRENTQNIPTWELERMLKGTITLKISSRRHLQQQKLQPGCLVFIHWSRSPEMIWGRDLYNMLLEFCWAPILEKQINVEIPIIEHMPYW